MCLHIITVYVKILCTVVDLRIGKSCVKKPKKKPKWITRKVQKIINIIKRTIYTGNT